MNSHDKSIQVARREEEKTLKALQKKRRTIIKNTWDLYEEEDLEVVEDAINRCEKRLGIWKDAVD